MLKDRSIFKMASGQRILSCDVRSRISSLKLICVLWGFTFTPNSCTRFTAYTKLPFLLGGSSIATTGATWSLVAYLVPGESDS